jgi:MoxR-like ATPase
MSTLTFRDLDGTPRTATWAEVFASATRIQDYFNAVRMRFAERDALVEKVKLAFMMREHLIVDGPTGAGKSAVLDTVMAGISGARTWSLDMSKFTTDTHLFGAYDVRAMREDGQMIHLTEGSLIEANFAKGGEFLDASDPTLRTLLNVMNERVVKRPPREYRVPLVSFVADTNFRIDDMPGRRQQLAAVLDRFLFQVTVDYVRDPRQRYAMLEMALESANRAKLPELTLADVVCVSGIIHDNDLVTDRYVREAYQEMTWEYSTARRAAGRSELSDRRFVKAAHLLEVNAILHGRSVCTFDDLEATRHVLVQHADDDALFDDAKISSIEKWAAKAQRREIDHEMNRLTSLAGRVPSPKLAGMPIAQLQRVADELNRVLGELNAFQPQSVEVRAEHTRTFTRIHTLLAAVDRALIAQLVERLPVLDGAIEPALLGPLMQTTQQIEAELRRIVPKSDSARAELATALERAGQTIARLQVEFMGTTGR